MALLPPYTFQPLGKYDEHWHADEVHAYIMEGETDFFDAKSGNRTQVKAGDKILIPAKVVLAEGAVKERVVYILALPKPLPREEFLAMHESTELSV
ncbi:hypothetical protein GPLA_2042 [Paraglaciecola polaris LMG 21857]|uniref:Cupin 2 conserved barrel domain-containing protein n=1 Tax=Paraglaciecola polaris LMG 21857 TaxID=1129793 RepID=K6ZVY4_9ALTE|nr:hypothetical protein GPLA_2042 [Paraglaciecola polaris LMG 21857]|tara:strand:+ start:349 stop:636 length:288 start_codon:yes stop_codon:yes gene_type:complete